MYAQLVEMYVSPEQMNELRAVIADKYLPVVEDRPGFISGYLLEQADEPGHAQMLLIWENHDSAETFTRTGHLASSFRSIAAHVPGLRIQRQGFIVRVSTEGSGQTAIV